MKIVEYVTQLGSDGRRRTRHVRIDNRIIEFVVQYEIQIENKWYPVIRYDTAHGFAHKDKMSYSGEVTKEELPFSEYNLALTYAEKDLKDNWKVYRENFLKEMRKNE